MSKAIMRFRVVNSSWRQVVAQASLLAISATVVVVWISTKPIVFTQDTLTYIDLAHALQVGQSENADYLRLPVFPLILSAFHVTDLKHSVFWLIIFQSFLAVTSCWLFYLATRRLEPRGAYVLALVFIASLLPFMQVKYIMTEQTFFFETILALYGLIVYLTARTNRDALLAVVILSVAAAAMMLTRPQGAYVAPVLLGTVALLAWRRAWAAALGAVLIIGIVWSSQFVDQRLRLGFQNSAGSLDNSYSTGKMLFFTFYLDGSSRANIPVVPENGPATAELKALLLDEFAKTDTLARRRGYLLALSPQDVPPYVERMFRAPDSTFWNLISFHALDERLGVKGADRLLLQVCLEAALAHPMETARLFIGKAFKIYFDPEMLVMPTHPQFPPGSFHPPLSDEIAAAGNYTDPTSMDRTIDNNLRWLMRCAILMAILTLPVALRYPTWRVTIALLIFGLYLNFAVVVGVNPLFRYAIYAIPANLLCAYLGVVASIALLVRYLKQLTARRRYAARWRARAIFAWKRELPETLRSPKPVVESTGRVGAATQQS
jgi:hypothetical protein